MRFLSFYASLFLLVALAASLPLASHGALIDQVNQAFRSVYGRNPTGSEWQYWAYRVQRGDKKTMVDLMGAMAFHKHQQMRTVPLSSAPPVWRTTPPWCQPQYLPVR
jgi:hypothetical protein